MAKSRCGMYHTFPIEHSTLEPLNQGMAHTIYTFPSQAIHPCTHVSSLSLKDFPCLNVFAFFYSFIPTCALVLEDILGS
jgi:hypothetical protein